jgi:ribosome-associated toxin RatA of RatAB toxin-antitoxin module
MSELSGSTSAEIAADVERCWAVVRDVERWPQWQRTLERLDVVQRDADGRPVVCDTVTDAKLTRVSARVSVTYDPPLRVSWSMVESDHLDSMHGSWELEELGSGRTRATYRLAVDPGRIGLLARPMERIIRPLVMGHQADELAAELARSA